MSDETSQQNALTLAKAIGIVVLIPFAFVGSAILSGWVFQLLWRWFVAQPFGTAELSLAHAIGLGLLVRFLARDLRVAEGQERWSIGKGVTRTIGWAIGILGVLALGYLVKLFM